MSLEASSNPGGAAPRVADSIARTLKAYGVRYAFGIPGNDVLETIRACEEHGIEFILAKSEPSAAFMADAVYQLTGAPSVLIPALGPGIANAVSGIAGAWMERSAVVVLSGEMATNRLGIYNHQVCDHVALATPVTKYAANLNPDRPAQHVAKALDIALDYPPGPVLLNVPADCNRRAAQVEETLRPASVASAQLAAGQASELAQLLQEARNPVVLAGRGCLQPGVADALRQFVECWQFPVLTTYKAKGVVDETGPLSLGAVGLSPVVDARVQELLDRSDRVVMVGFDPIELRDAWLNAWPEARACVSIDWSVQNHRIFPVGRQAVGDVAAILGQLRPADGAQLRFWADEYPQQLKRELQELTAPRAPAQGISPAGLFRCVSDHATSDWLMTVDVGAHRILANHVIRCTQPGQLLQSNGLGCMGYAVPAAIGAQVVHPDKTVVALLGDGCMLMTQGELALAAERNLPLVVVVLNDAALSLIKLKQSKMNMQARAVDFVSPRFDQIAEGFGARGVRVQSIDAFDAALREAVASRRLTVIDAQVDPSEYWDEM
ncbi:MAG: thiamine pyrophosphate-binding protein [Gammaproteobacteria bacterium]